MEGILPFQTKPVQVVAQQPNPWSSLAPSLIQAVILSKLKGAQDESLLQKQMEIELAKQGYTPAGGEQQQPGIMSKILGAVGLGGASPAPSPQSPSAPPSSPDIQGAPVPGTINIMGKPYTLPVPKTSKFGNGLEMIEYKGTVHFNKPTTDVYVNPQTMETRKFAENDPIPPGFMSKDIYTQLMIGDRQNKAIQATSDRQIAAQVASDARQAAALAAADERLQKRLENPKPDTTTQLRINYQNLNKQDELSKQGLAPPLTPEQKADMAAWEKAQGYAGVARTQAWGDIKTVKVYDAATDKTEEIPINEYNQKRKENPDRYYSQTPAINTMKTHGLITDIETGSKMANDALNNFSTPFTTAQKAELSYIESHVKPEGFSEALGNFLRSKGGESLTPDQINWINSVRSLRERSMSLRTLGGQGTGSDQQREEILRTVPSVIPPSKEFAADQLKKFDQQVSVFKASTPNKALAKQIEDRVAGADVQPPPQTQGAPLIAAGKNGQVIWSPNGGKNWYDSKTNQEVK